MARSSRIRGEYTEADRRRLLREAAQLHDGGMTWPSVAAQLGVALSTLHYWRSHRENGGFAPVVVSDSDAADDGGSNRQTDPTMTSGMVLEVGRGLRVTGLTLAGLVHLLRALA